MRSLAGQSTPDASPVFACDNDSAIEPNNQNQNPSETGIPQIAASQVPMLRQVGVKRVLPLSPTIDKSDLVRFFNDHGSVSGGSQTVISTEPSRVCEAYLK